jgi:hypothetical protein
MKSKDIPGPARGREEQGWRGPPATQDTRPTTSERGLHGEHRVGGATGHDEDEVAQHWGQEPQPLRSGAHAGQTMTRGTGQAGQEDEAALGGTRGGPTADAATGGAGNPDLQRERKERQARKP